MLKVDISQYHSAYLIFAKLIMQSKVDLLRQGNARLIARITELEQTTKENAEVHKTGAWYGRN